MPLYIFYETRKYIKGKNLENNPSLQNQTEKQEKQMKEYNDLKYVNP